MRRAPTLKKGLTLKSTATVPFGARADCKGQTSACSCYPVNKLTSVFYASVLLLIMNFVITLSK